MNSLQRDIVTGSVVIIHKDFCHPKYTNLLEIAFIASHGFGMYTQTTGTAIYGEWLDGSGEDRIEGNWIDKEATEKYCQGRQELLQQIENIKQQLRQWQPPAVRRILREQLALHEAEVAASDYGGGGLT